jgi:hypothetical protein
MNIFIEPDELSKDDFWDLLTDEAVDSEIRGWLADLFCQDNKQFDACELADYITTIDLFNNIKHAIMIAWEGTQRHRMPKRFFLSGCTG